MPVGTPLVRMIISVHQLALTHWPLDQWVAYQSLGGGGGESVVK